MHKAPVKKDQETGMVIRCNAQLLTEPTSFSFRAASFSCLAFSFSASFSALHPSNLIKQLLACIVHRAWMAKTSAVVCNIICRGTTAFAVEHAQQYKHNEQGYKVALRL
jgi:hypothetical protein